MKLSITTKIDSKGAPDVDDPTFLMLDTFARFNLVINPKLCANYLSRTGLKITCFTNALIFNAFKQ